VEKSYCLNIETQNKEGKETIAMSIPEYFETLKYVLMTATFVVLVLIFLYMFYGKEEKVS